MEETYELGRIRFVKSQFLNVFSVDGIFNREEISLFRTFPLLYHSRAQSHEESHLIAHQAITSSQPPRNFSISVEEEEKKKKKEKSRVKRLNRTAVGGRRRKTYSKRLPRGMQVKIFDLIPVSPSRSALDKAAPEKSKKTNGSTVDLACSHAR